jgi:hypothetical protein
MSKALNELPTDHPAVIYNNQSQIESYNMSEKKVMQDKFRQLFKDTPNGKKKELNAWCRGKHELLLPMWFSGKATPEDKVEFLADLETAITSGDWSKFGLDAEAPVVSEEERKANVLADVKQGSSKKQIQEVEEAKEPTPPTGGRDPQEQELRSAKGVQAVQDAKPKCEHGVPLPKDCDLCSAEMNKEDEAEEAINKLADAGALSNDELVAMLAERGYDTSTLAKKNRTIKVDISSFTIEVPHDIDDDAIDNEIRVVLQDVKFVGNHVEWEDTDA